MDFLDYLRRKVKGKKTYIVCFLLFLISFVNLLYGDVTIVQFLQDPSVSGFMDLLNDKDSLTALGALGGASLRASNSK